MSGALAADAIYVDSTEIITRINNLGLRLDIDNNGSIDALTDGLLILRFLFGLSGEALITGVVAPNATRNTIDQIESYISTLTNLNVEPPVFTSPSSFSVEENQTLIGAVTVTDVDSDESLITFSISGANLSISSDGILSFNRAPDYESQSQYTATITASDGLNTSSQEIIINILNVIEPPYFVSPTNFSVEENQDRVGVIQAWDVETSSSITSFSVSGDEFLFDEQSVLRFAQLPDYEDKSLYYGTLTAIAPDNRPGATQDITVTITDTNDAPYFSDWRDDNYELIASPDFVVDEGFDTTKYIGAFRPKDQDGDETTFSISGDEIKIAGYDKLYFVNTPDFETKAFHQGVLTISDGELSTTQEFTVTIRDLDDTAPVFTSNHTFSVPEDQTEIGTVTATDVDTDDSLINFSISGSELLLSSEGVLTFVSAPDYETKSSYTATVTATDGTNSSTQDIIVEVTDIDDNENSAPIFTSSPTFIVNENQVAIGLVVAMDADGDSLVYSLSGSDASLISINSASGVLTFNIAPDYETKTSYSATVTATKTSLRLRQRIRHCN